MRSYALVAILIPLVSLASAAATEPPTTSFEPDSTTRPDLKPYYFSIPAPRGQILDRNGKTLAHTRAIRCLQLTVPVAEQASPDSYKAFIKAQLSEINADLGKDHSFSDEFLDRYYKDRRTLPLLIAHDIPEDLPMPTDHCSPRSIFVRNYPNNQAAAHLLGYVSANGPSLTGPFVPNEPFWQPIAGTTGIEKTYDEHLKGQNGKLCLMISDSGIVENTQIFEPPITGRDIVTTINLDTQLQAEKALTKSKRRSTIVIVDAFTGDLRALASNPAYDPNAFALGISATDYSALSDDPEAPLYHRAVQGTYPPGSVFKPFVVFAGLRYGTVPAWQEFECGPSLMIDGREFGNWSDSDAGLFNARAALIRSCNPYFYQSAMITRDEPILTMAQAFGFGTPPALPFPTAAGTLPKSAPSNHDLANLSIGQGVTEASPLQVAFAMATIANGTCRPHPRLVTQTQSQSGITDHIIPPARDALMPVNATDLETVRHAMFGVVNHINGTAKSARLNSVAVFGKTGTAQWVLHGKEANVVWFAGYLDTEPPLAFACTVEGNPGEGGLSGGGTAAPLIAQVLKHIESNPKTHDVKYKEREVLQENDILFIAPTPPLADSEPPQDYRISNRPSRGFFERFFR